MEEKFISNNEKEHREILEYHKKWYKKWWGILILVLLSLFLIFLTASSFYVFDLVKKIQKEGFLGENNLNVKVYSKSELEGKDSYAFGSKNPKITIVEFSDYACPNCKSFFETTKKIRMKYYSNLKIIHRDFPILTDYSVDLALAVRCAGEQGLYWKAHDALYENQGISSKEDIYSLMLKIGADENRLIDCLDNNKYLGLIQDDLKDGLNLDIKGTPTWFINGHRADGNMPEEMLNNYIENILLNN